LKKVKNIFEEKKIKLKKISKSLKKILKKKIKLKKYQKV